MLQLALTLSGDLCNANVSTIDTTLVPFLEENFLQPMTPWDAISFMHSPSNTKEISQQKKPFSDEFNSLCDYASIGTLIKLVRFCRINASLSKVQESDTC